MRTNLYLCIGELVDFYPTILAVKSYCFILAFDPAQNAIQGDAPEGSDTFQWPVIERDRVGGFG